MSGTVLYERVVGAGAVMVTVTVSHEWVTSLRDGLRILASVQQFAERAHYGQPIALELAACVERAYGYDLSFEVTAGRLS